MNSQQSPSLSALTLTKDGKTVYACDFDKEKATEFQCKVVSLLERISDQIEGLN